MFHVGLQILSACLYDSLDCGLADNIQAPLVLECPMLAACADCDHPRDAYGMHGKAIPLHVIQLA